MKGRASTARTTCLIGLGSNLGARESNLRFAIGRIRRLPKTTLVATSSFYRTKAVGPGRQPDYFNAAARIRTGLSPMGLLIELKRIEALRGRKSGKRWRPRVLDCDLLFYGREKLRRRFITVPHPRALGRAFVLAPLCDLGAGWVPPVSPRLSVGARLVLLSRRPRTAKAPDGERDRLIRSLCRSRENVRVAP